MAYTVVVFCFYKSVSSFNIYYGKTTTVKFIPNLLLHN